MRQQEAVTVHILGQCARFGRVVLILTLMMLAPVAAIAAPYAAMVIDARSGEVLHSRNADTRLHPASLTKMMTLYIAFEAVEHGEISLDTLVTISSHAASEPPSKLGLKAGQKIKLRYLIRAAAVKSANDAATAIGEAIEGSEPAFARRMTRTAKALGMSRTTFKNAHGLTEDGHLSTARDMTTLGRHLFYDYPEYYNLFSRQSTHAGIKTVTSHNRLLTSYKGADGIKTGYTRAAGFNLVASAERKDERIIATVFGGRSSATRNAKVAELLDLGFSRAPRRVALNRPAKPAYLGPGGGEPPRAGKTVRVAFTIKSSPRPRPRPVQAPPEELIVAMQDDILDAVKEATQADETQDTAAAEAAPATVVPEPRPVPVPEPEITVAAAPAGAVQPRPRPATPPAPETVTLATLRPADTDTQEVVTRLSSSGGRHWGINVGRYGSRYEAERMLLKTALKELGTLDDALRKVSQTSRGFDANFVGMTQQEAALACRRLTARGTECATFGPS